MRVDFVHRLPATPDRVYAALLDPETVRRCIKDCERLSPIGTDVYEAKVGTGLASIKGRVRLTAARPGESMTLTIEGKGLPGSVTATMTVRLLAQGGQTEVRGEGEISVGGLAAALGPKMIESGAQAAIADFYQKLAAQLTSSGT
jgi:carbon monoxide dehydrogenase subunit G